MWVEAILLKEDLVALVTEFAPVTIRLGDDGELHVTDPSDIMLVADVGLRVACKARLRWSVLGITVPVPIQSLVVLLRPEIAMTPSGQQVVFKLEIEHADLSGLPSLVDDRVTELVNRELAAKHVELAWNYAGTLTHAFALPDALQPLERLELTVAGARIKATSEALGLAIEFRAKVSRAEGESAVRDRPRVDGAVRSVVAPPPPVRRWRSGVILGTLATAALGASYALGRVLRRR